MSVMLDPEHIALNDWNGALWNMARDSTGRWNGWNDWNGIRFW